MKKIFNLLSVFCLSLLFTGCFEKVDNEIIDDCVVSDDCIEYIEEDLSTKYFSAFGTEPYWDFEIIDGIAKLSTPMYDTDYSVPVKIRKEGENYYFSGEELEGEFIKKDCIDGGKGDMHYYTVGVAKYREYYYEGCGDDEDGIKMSDEDISSSYQEDDEEIRIQKIVEERINNGFSDMETCMHTLNQYLPERMPGDPQTTITVGCGLENYGEVVITGYLYTSVYPDLGIRITTPKGYDTFYEKSETPIFIRNGDKISNNYEYIRVYEKSEDDSLFDIINKKHLHENCSAYQYDYEGQNKIYGIADNMIYDIHNENNRGEIDIDICIADDEAGNQNYQRAWFFESRDRTKYYKLVFSDGCAPGPCSMFGEVEIF